MSLRFTEEIILLLLDDESGRMTNLPDWAFRLAMSGSVLMDLALERKIDSDLKELIVTDPMPTGDPILDPSLELIAKHSRQ